MTVFQGAVDATFAAFGVYALYTPAGGEPIPVRIIARRPDTIVGFGETRIHAEAATFEVRASEVANPRPGDQLTIGGESFVVQGEPERRDPDRLVWSLDVRPASAEPMAVLVTGRRAPSPDATGGLGSCQRDCAERPRAHRHRRKRSQVQRIFASRREFAGARELQSSFASAANWPERFLARTPAGPTAYPR
jgi:hypothetical protein